MNHIYILEDEQLHREKLRLLIKKNPHYQQLNYQLAEEITTSEELFNHLKKAVKNNIYFLDIDLNEDLDGIQIAKIIREKDPFGMIIFVTSHDDRVFETINTLIEPLGYLVKQDYVSNRLENKLSDIFQLALNKIQQLEPIIELKSPTKTYRLQVNDIIFAETVPQSKKTEIHLSNSLVIVNLTIKELKKQLNADGFYMDLQSYIINTNKIRLIDSKTGTIYFYSNQSIQAGRRTLEKLKRFLNNHQ